MGFLKFLIKEQKKNKLSQDDVIEILRIKLEPYDFEIFETRVEIDGFFKAFEYLRKTNIARPQMATKLKHFINTNFNFKTLLNHYECFRKKQHTHSQNSLMTKLMKR